MLPDAPTHARWNGCWTNAVARRAFKNAASGAPDAAWQLLRWASGLEWGRALIVDSKSQPARRSLAPEWTKSVRQLLPETQNVNLDVFVKAFDYARPQHSFSNNPKAYEILTSVLDSVYNKNEVSATQAFKEAAPKVTQLLQSLKK